MRPNANVKKTRFIFHDKKFNSKSNTYLNKVLRY